MRSELSVRDAAFQQDMTDVPNLIEIQQDSFRWFLEEGIRELFHNFSPIEDFTGNMSLELVDYFLEEPKYSQEECRQRDMTYEAPIKVLVRLRASGREVLESEVYLGALPLMTERGTFLINGAERVVVSQLARSPGAYFDDPMDISGRILYNARIIPNEGAWTEVETESNDAITVRIGQTKKFAVTTLLRALNFTDRSKPVHAVPPAGLRFMQIMEPLVDRTTGEVLLEAGVTISRNLFTELIEPRLDQEGVLPETINAFTPCTSDREILDLFTEPQVLENPDAETGERKPLTRDLLLDRRPVEDVADKAGKIIARSYAKIDRDAARRMEGLGLDRLDVLSINRFIEATLDMDPTHDENSALLDIYRKVRPGDPATLDSARQMLGSIYYDLRRYDLAKVGRYKINKKLRQSVPLRYRCLTREDVLNLVRYIIEWGEGDDTKSRDDIDHLENKRVRSVGELLQNQLRMGFLRMEKVAKERMTSMDPDNASPQLVLSVKPISASVKSFFGSSQLCQFMDQHNPLAELTHKRRLSALGPGGLSRQSAKLEVRDVHHSHYGRICPIETPEGPNIGLIGSMAIFTKIDEYGFLKAPYREVVNGLVTGKIDYITADDEENAAIAPASVQFDPETGVIQQEVVQVRLGTQFPEVSRHDIRYIDRSPMQIFSAAASLIPFLENDDANRALMGSNMQRQAVPLVRATAPIIRTGIEEKIAVDSGAVVTARRPGRVERVTCEQVEVRGMDGQLDVYPLQNMLRSNQNTCITQKPIVSKGQRVRPGSVLADGPCTDKGNLALGQNILAAFVTWEGYNYEDAIILSQRIVRDDVFTSIHIEKFEKEARDTKLGPEEITRDIPNVGEEALKDLDENGVVRIGAEVHADDILVGMIAPKSQGEQSAEERLIIAIFGKKAEEASDNSLRVPHGGKGKVVDVKVFSRFKYRCAACRHVFDYSKKPDRLTCDRCGGELTREPGDELPAGVNQLVRVYVAQKRKIMEGDKMAGRHGNKGVISRILSPEEMPHLPDGTPVDIILNPLGVPSRMNIGQILETHLGYVGQALGVSFAEPIFRGSKEPEVLVQLDRLVEHYRFAHLREYVMDEVLFRLYGAPQTEVVDPATGQVVARRTEAFTANDTDSLIGPLDVPGHTSSDAPDGFNGLQVNKELPSDRLMAVLGRILETRPQEDLDRLGEWLGLGFDEQAVLEPLLAGSNGAKSEFRLAPRARPDAAPRSVSAKEILDCVSENVTHRVNPFGHTGKSVLINGQTGEPFNQPVTVGYIYMMKLLHLVEDKIHARSTGPYALVTQQPLGGKAQFGGQRFGEMEVWALEAYGAAYTLQEILTIKSDDVLGRVKTYESIVKGDQILEPGVPESFKILVAELQNLGLKVTVEDETDRVIDLRLQDDDIPDDSGRGNKRHPVFHEEG